jgi:hypothetical protein
LISASLTLKILTILKPKLMKTRFILRLCVLYILIFIPFTIFGQPVSSKWIAPPYQFDFNNNLSQTPLPDINSGPDNIELYYEGQNAKYASNAMYTASGKLLFFVVDNMVYDGDGYAIDHLTYDNTNYGWTTGFAEIIILPVSGSCSKFYIITSYVESDNIKICYTTLDILASNLIHSGKFGALQYFNGSYQTNGTNCKLILSNLGVNNCFASGSSIFSHIAASTLKANGERFLFINCASVIYRCNINSSGIELDINSNDQGVLNVSQAITGSNYDFLRSEAELKHIGIGGVEWKIAVPFNLQSNGQGGNGPSPFIYVASLDINGEVISGTERTCNIPTTSGIAFGYKQRSKGLEFSENGNYLYATLHNDEFNSGNFEPVGYYDINVNNPILVGNDFTPMPFVNDNSYQWSQIETGSDNKLYITNGTKFATLSNSENPTTNNWIEGSNFANPIQPSYADYTIGGFILENSFKLYTLPDQIDQEDYSNLFGAPTKECCLVNQDFYKDQFGNYNLTITSTTMGNQLAQNDMKFNGTVTIAPNVLLSLYDRTWEFGPLGRLVVSVGARLILNNTTLKAVDCGVLWQGVEVWGNPIAIQNFSNQGYVNMSNKSMITNAYIGINTGSIPSVAGVGGGGIIRAQNSAFVDNRQDVSMTYYLNSNFDNMSYFIKCEFLSQAPLPFPHVLTKHVFLSNVNTVRFTECNFECLYYPSSAVEYGIGIDALDAKFSVKGTCNGICDIDNMNPSSFTNLYKGITARRWAKNRVYWVDLCTFNNCMTGVENSGVDYGTIIRSKFELGSFPILGQNFGINLQRGTGFIIEENRMKQTNNYGKNFTGILAFDNTPVGGDNRIYNNAFYNLKIANMSNYTNRSDNNTGINPFSGLQYFCNYNENIGFGFYDFVVRGDAQGQNQGIRLYQGGNSTGGFGGAAGNIFSHRDAIPNETDFYQNTSEVGSVVYSQYAPGGVPDPDQECIDFSGNVIPVGTGTIGSCPATYGTSPLRMFTNGELEGFEQEFESLAAAKSITVNNLNSLIDAGNTFQLLNNVDNTNSNASEALKYQLLNSSPFLSDEVIKEASNKTWVLNNFTVMQLFFANPDAARKKTLMEFLATKDDPMATWMIDAIKENATAASARTSLESTIAAYNSRQSEIVNRVIASFLMDTIPVDSTLFTKWANKLNCPSGDYMVAENMMQNGQNSAAKTILNQVPTKYNLSAEEITKHNALMAIYELSNVLKTSNRDASQLNLAEIVAIQNIAEGERCLAKTMANNILELNGVEPVVEEVLYPEPRSEERRSNSKNNGAINTLAGYELKAYPNPANEQLTIELPEGIFFITFYNAQGQLMNEFAQQGLSKINLDTKQFTDGIYLLRVFE